MQVYGGAEFPAYVIDGETLREELLSEEDTLEWLAETPADPHAVSFWRMLGELDQALAVGEGALAEREPMTPGWAAAAVRLAHVHHWREEYAEAHELLNAAEEVFASSGQGGGADGRMLAFVRQHRAKALFDEGRLADAEAQALTALRLREELGEPEGVLASSRETVARIRREGDRGGHAARGLR
ncbi:tetratricopeptide repeat protein [Ornithinimicrobium sufpigmenti]|uniref:tetratricopeptide repeat protein n=1 Tax=Ornithinimicrobium sufpigmenti TaxID=2508882 RepID=UPI001035D956|nr:MULTISPECIES: tetratricopeptide repeat protein [unclassified Ornithinimicrobium]